jgi:tetratricopeptide (TPR) repeat protein
VRGSTGKVPWEKVGGSNIPAEAISLHEKGRAAGSRGDLKASVDLFTRAAALAPAWPYPVYDRAYSHLQLGNADAALADYQKTIALAPRGFFTAFTALDALSREARGELPEGLYFAFTTLEFLDPATANDAVRQLIKKVPRFAPAWMKLASITDDLSQRLVVIENGLGAAPDAETRGMLLLNKAMALHARGDRTGAIAILGEVVLDPASTLSSAVWARFQLESIVTK